MVEVVQFLFNGVVQASIVLMGAVGINLLYGVKKFANFAHGDMMTMGAYFTWYFLPRSDFVVATIYAAVIVAMVALVQELLVYSRLEGRGPVSPLVASIGVALILQNSISTYFGPSFLAYTIRYPDNFLLLGGLVSVNVIRDLLPLSIGGASCAIILLLLKYTKLGKAMRATADNRELARVSGVNTRVVYWATWIIAGVFASVGGTVTGVTSGILTPSIGQGLLLTMFAAVIVGGIGSTWGAILGSILVGEAQSLFFALSIVTGIDTRWQLAVPFALLVAVLLLRPSGLVGKAIGMEVRPLRVEVAEMLKGLRRGLF
jgi:branched-chain amino acid transport system permease protein